MKVKVSEATGVQLDWMVTKAEDRIGKWLDLGSGTSAEDVVLIGRTLSVYQGGRPDYTYYAPSTIWSQGGPIIEREGIDLHFERNSDGHIVQVWADDDRQPPENWYCGPTPLIAAMRCYVASKLGDEVEVPEELSSLGVKP